MGDGAEADLSLTTPGYEYYRSGTDTFAFVCMENLFLWHDLLLVTSGEHYTFKFPGKYCPLISVISLRFDARSRWNEADAGAAPQI